MTAIPGCCTGAMQLLATLVAPDKLQGMILAANTSFFLHRHAVTFDCHALLCCAVLHCALHCHCVVCIAIVLSACRTFRSCMCSKQWQLGARPPAATAAAQSAMATRGLAALQLPLVMKAGSWQTQATPVLVQAGRSRSTSCSSGRRSRAGLPGNLMQCSCVLLCRLRHWSC